MWRHIIRLYIFTPWSLDLFICVPFQLHGEHTVLQPCRRIERTHCHLCPTRYSFLPESSEAFEGEVPCPRHNVLPMSKRKLKNGPYAVRVKFKYSCTLLACRHHFRSRIVLICIRTTIYSIQFSCCSMQQCSYYAFPLNFPVTPLFFHIVPIIWSSTLFIVTLLYCVLSPSNFLFILLNYYLASPCNFSATFLNFPITPLSSSLFIITLCNFIFYCYI